MTIQEILALLIQAAIIPLAAWGVSALTDWLKTKADNERLNKYFDIANDAVITAVTEIMQTFVGELKKSGEWTPERAQEALQRAKLRAQEIMGAATYKALGEIVGDVDGWLTSKAEAATFDIKAVTK